MPQFDDEGLVIPRKPHNPCIDSTERRSLNKEIVWNQKVGKNVLEQKNELQKVMEKRNDEKKKKEMAAEKLTRRSSLERRLEEQQLKLKLHEESESVGNSSSPDKEKDKDDSPQSEFLKIYSKMKSANETSNNNNSNKSVAKNDQNVVLETSKSGTSTKTLSETSSPEKR